jgi:hypothetical protein
LPENDQVGAPRRKPGHLFNEIIQSLLRGIDGTHGQYD